MSRTFRYLKNNRSTTSWEHSGRATLYDAQRRMEVDGLTQDQAIERAVAAYYADKGKNFKNPPRWYRKLMRHKPRRAQAAQIIAKLKRMVDLNDCPEFLPVRRHVRRCDFW